MYMCANTHTVIVDRLTHRDSEFYIKQEDSEINIYMSLSLSSKLLLTLIFIIEKKTLTFGHTILHKDNKTALRSMFNTELCCTCTN